MDVLDLQHVVERLADGIVEWKVKREMKDTGSTDAAAVVAAEWRAILEFDPDLIDPAMVRAAYAQPGCRNCIRASATGSCT
ncbi:hypothetical protein ACIQMR_28100 [Streptomyces sp. NPDC091376]|uniref:hypothetical protein n=1 Tax=Streptomyces sp. NPDC091376 TaxID=3365994 RepID=UPI0038016DD5